MAEVTATLYPSDDTEVIENIPDTNYGSIDQVVVAGNTADFAIRILAKFDLSSIPITAAIYSALLRLRYFDDIGQDPVGRTYNCHRVTADWAELVATWNNQPAHAAGVTAALTMPAAYGWVEWELDDDVQDMIDAVVSNYGWKVKDNVESGGAIKYGDFRSKEYDSLDPELVIIYEETLYQKYTTGDNAQAGWYGAFWGAQSFTPVLNHKITSLKIKVFRTGSPGTVTVSIKGTDGDGKPTGADLASGTFDGNAVTTDTAGEWKEIVFSSPYTLRPGTKFAQVLRAPDGDASNKLNWRLDTATAAYPGGEYLLSANSGSTWTAIPTYDLLFVEFGIPVSPAGLNPGLQELLLG